MKFSMGDSVAAKYEIDPSLARPVVRKTAECAEQLTDPLKGTEKIDAPPEVPPVVSGAVEEFFAERRRAVRDVRDRALAVTDAAMGALAAYDAGDQEMARTALSLAARAGADAPKEG